MYLNCGDHLFDFRIEAKEGAARAGVLHLPHGEVETPVFMPVGTQAAVKTLTSDEVAVLGAQIILANTYHLYLRPGYEIVREMGGVHRFQQWAGPVLTDSGGFQVFSLAHISTIAEEGVTFQSHIDGSRHLFTPERVMEIQRALGADIIMAFDQCPPGQADHGLATEAMERTLRWLARCRDHFAELERRSPEGPMQTLFPIVQGAVDPELRRASARATLELGDWKGVAIGGLSVGESKAVMYEMLEVLEPELPPALPRYLMGVGYPEDLLEAIGRGVDMFGLRSPHPQTAATVPCGWKGKGRSTSSRPAFGRIQDLWIPSATATLAASTHGPICGICSWPASRSACACCRSTTCAFWSGSPPAPARQFAREPSRCGAEAGSNGIRRGDVALCKHSKDPEQEIES